MTTINEVILASGSKFRQALLRATGLEFRALTSEVDEKKIIAESGDKMALARAHAKAKAVCELVDNAVVIGADQTLSFNGRIYDKASTRVEGKKRLEEFSGNTHHLHSAVVLYKKIDGKITLESEFCVDVAMTMKCLSEDLINNYLDTNEWKGCVGCYQAENKGSLLFSAIDGNNSAVIGLPICEVSSELEKIGINALLNPTGPWET